MAQAQAAAYNRTALITKSDTVNFDGSLQSAVAAGNKAVPCDAIFVGGAGIVVVVFEDGSTGQFTCAVGQILPVKAIRVNSTTTAATLMQALYTV